VDICYLFSCNIDSRIEIISLVRWHLLSGNPYPKLKSSQNSTDMSTKFGQKQGLTQDWYFCIQKLMRTDIFFTRTTKPILKFVNPDNLLWK
jgi:hypothetical protein